MVELTDEQLSQLADMVADRVVARMPVPATRLVDINELAEASGLAVSTLFLHMKQKRLTRQKIGGALRFDLNLALRELAKAD